jgi:aryl-alcohol dehydrogenase-like predicted oxidoreductase
MKLAIGSAQFGMDYGISNSKGRVPVNEVAAILRTAIYSGLQLVDTAPLYGESESVLGELLPTSSGVQIVTKTPARMFHTARSDGSGLQNSISQSLVRLRRGSVYGYLIHQAEDLLREGGELLWEEMRRVKQLGLANRIGVSIYEPQQALELIDRYDVDIIQLPLSVVDQRMVTSGVLNILRTAGVEIHARSAFLQGALLMQDRDLPEFLCSLRENCRQFERIALAHELTRLQAAIMFVKQLALVDYLVVGICNQDELVETIRAFSLEVANHIEFTTCASSDLNAILPTRWSSLTTTTKHL